MRCDVMRCDVMGMIEDCWSRVDIGEMTRFERGGLDEMVCLMLVYFPRSEPTDGDMMSESVIWAHLLTPMVK